MMFCLFHVFYAFSLVCCWEFFLVYWHCASIDYLCNCYFSRPVTLYTNFNMYVVVQVTSFTSFDW